MGIYLFVAAIIGSVLGVFFQPSLLLLALGFLLLGLPLAVVFSKFWQKGALLFLASICLAAFFATHEKSQFDSEIAKIPQKKAIFEGVITELSPRLEKGQKAVLRVHAVIEGSKATQANFVLSLSLFGASSALGFQVADKIRVFGRAHPVKSALSPGEFDPYLFGFARKVHAHMFVEK